MKITIEVPDEAIKQAIKAARIRYWAKVESHSPVLSLIEISDAGEETEQHVMAFGCRAMTRAVATMAVAHPQRFARIVNGRADGEDGDLLIQYACFGELKYG